MSGKIIECLCDGAVQEGDRWVGGLKVGASSYLIYVNWSVELEGVWSV